MQPIRVVINAGDPIIAAGLTNYLQPHEDIEIQREMNAETTVLVVATERISPVRLRALAPDLADTDTPVVLIVNEVNHDELLMAIDMGVVAILPRSAVSVERLHQTVVVTASGGAVMPNDLLGGLLRHFERLQREVLIPNGLSGLGFTTREVEVLRLMADGLDTAEIAHKMAYSERTIKGIVSSAIKRLNLRNRAHAVAYACRSGAI